MSETSGAAAGGGADDRDRISASRNGGGVAKRRGGGGEGMRIACGTGVRIGTPFGLAATSAASIFPVPGLDVPAMKPDSFRRTMSFSKPRPMLEAKAPISRVTSASSS